MEHKEYDAIIHFTWEQNHSQACNNAHYIGVTHCRGVARKLGELYMYSHVHLALIIIGQLLYYIGYIYSQILYIGF